MKRIAIASFTLVFGLAAASTAQAQSGNVLVCNDGQVLTAAYGTRACDAHGGVNSRATIQAQQSGRYNPTATNGTYGTRGVYGGGAGGAGTRGVYNGGVPTNGGVYTNGNGYPGSRAQRQCADGSWSSAGASGCHGHGGVLKRTGNNGMNGRYDGHRRDDDGDDDRDRGNRGHGKKDKKHDRDDRRDDRRDH